MGTHCEFSRLGFQLPVELALGSPSFGDGVVVSALGVGVGGLISVFVCFGGREGEKTGVFFFFVCFLLLFTSAPFSFTSLLSPYSPFIFIFSSFSFFSLFSSVVGGSVSPVHQSLDNLGDGI